MSNGNTGVCLLPLETEATLYVTWKKKKGMHAAVPRNINVTQWTQGIPNPSPVLEAPFIQWMASSFSGKPSSGKAERQDVPSYFAEVSDADAPWVWLTGLDVCPGCGHPKPRRVGENTEMARKLRPASVFRNKSTCLICSRRSIAQTMKFSPPSLSQELGNLLIHLPGHVVLSDGETPWTKGTCGSLASILEDA